MYSNPSLEHKLIEHEGMKKYAYQDSRGNLTIGIGRCIEPGNEGLTVDECFYLMRNDIDRLNRELSIYDWYKTQDEVRQGVLIEMAFNVGVAGLLGFKRFIEALKPINAPLAASEMLNSLWATQVGPTRANDMASRMRNGRYL